MMKSIKTFEFHFPLLFTKVSYYTNGVISEWRKTLHFFSFWAEPTMEAWDSIYSWLNKFILLTSDSTHLSLMISSLHKWILKVSLLTIVISLRTTCHSQKENDSQKRCYLKFLIHDYYCNKSSFELEKTRSYCSLEIYISLSHRMIKWRDDLIKQFTKPSPLILENN